MNKKSVVFISRKGLQNNTLMSSMLQLVSVGVMYYLRREAGHEHTAEALRHHVKLSVSGCYSGTVKTYISWCCHGY